MPAFAWNIPAATDQVISANITTDILAALNTVVAANSGGADAKWEVAGYSGSTPRYLILKRKSGAVGRIIIFGETGSTAHANATFVAASSGSCYIGYSPSSTSNTPDASWIAGAPLSASDYMKGMLFGGVSAATWRVNYAECEDGVAFLFTNTSAGIAICMAGELVVDMTGTKLPVVQANGSSSVVNWTTTTTNAGGLFPATIGSSASYTETDSGCQVRSAGVNRLCFRPFVMGVSGTAAKLHNTTNQKIYFYPVPLVYHNSDVTLNVAGKMSQMGYGPVCNRETTYSDGVTSAYGVGYQTSGASIGMFWFVDDEI